jgi:hypothetical protein
MNEQTPEGGTLTLTPTSTSIPNANEATGAPPTGSAPTNPSTPPSGEPTPETMQGAAAKATGGRRRREEHHPADRIVFRCSVAGLLRHVMEPFKEAEEEAKKDDPSFVFPADVAEKVKAIVTLYGEEIEREAAPILAPFRDKLAGLAEVREKREAEARAESLRKRNEEQRRKAAAERVAKDREKTKKDVEIMEARLAALKEELAKAEAAKIEAEAKAQAAKVEAEKLSA